MKFYHYTAKTNLQNILNQGLLPGSATKQKEQLPFIMLDRNRYSVETGDVVYIEVNLDESDPSLHWVNDSWVEYYGNIPAVTITAVANPPSNMEEVIALLDTEQYNAAWDYKAV